MAFIPIDATARDGSGHTFRAADQTTHAASWCALRQAYVYSDGTRVAPTLTHYLSRHPARAT
ncbi:hypothetical protein GCM10011614_16840 [Novosphingobium colocasiae]|uniref:Uncharacterized protein n=2 Tax=Novosphingobium colocasiae TaxID=1256513 RepID=A0A918UFX9_9SPHN|nr:hypothetical protein GCM10011614_16840 [Novosphingobium colocasiae]